MLKVVLGYGDERNLPQWKCCLKIAASIVTQLSCAANALSRSVATECAQSWTRDNSRLFLKRIRRSSFNLPLICTRYTDYTNRVASAVLRAKSFLLIYQIANAQLLHLSSANEHVSSLHVKRCECRSTVVQVSFPFVKLRTCFALHSFSVTCFKPWLTIARRFV